MQVILTRDDGPPAWHKFKWMFFKNGYRLEWRTPRKSPSPRIKSPVLVLAEATKDRATFYDPLEIAGLAAEFSELRAPEDCLDFANRRGFLGLHAAPMYREMHKDFLVGQEEDASSWLQESEILRRLVLIRNLVAKDNRRPLREIIRWSDDGVVAQFPGGINLLIADTARTSIAELGWKRGDVIEPAKLFILQQYNYYAYGLGSSMLMLDHGSLREHNSPINLLGAIWLELAGLATGQIRQVPCEVCGKPLDVTENRSHKRMHKNCSSRTRTARYRKSLEEKGQLHAKETRPK